MYLIVKGKKPKPICRGCKAIHAAKDCPQADGNVLAVFMDGHAGLTWAHLMAATGLQFFQVRASVDRLTETGYLKLPSYLYKETSDKNVTREIARVTKMSPGRGSAA